MFVALLGDPGPRFGPAVQGARDGHDFIDMATERGAAAIMCREGTACSVDSIGVADTLEGLWQLGQEAGSRVKGKKVVITGSSGKTTQRLWLETLLRQVGTVHASVGSFNNHWGVPLSLARMPVDIEYGVFEIGTNHAGEISPLSQIAQPDVAVLLNVLPAHIGNFSDMAALALEKLSIADGLATDGIFVLPYELAGQTDWPNTITFGASDQADVSGSVENGVLVADVLGRVVRLSLPWYSPERVSGVLASLAVLKTLGIDPEPIKQVYEKLPLPEGRGNTRSINGITVIDDSYNANPASMEMALRHLREMDTSGRKYAFLGEMLELGDYGPQGHESAIAEADGIDELFLFGDGFRGPGSGHAWQTSVEEFNLAVFTRRLQPGDTVLVKGSNKVFWKLGFVESLINELGRLHGQKLPD